jgi:hypothetical protein
MSNIINKIVANVKQSNNTRDNYINSNNIVCIDTSNNRIGINTKNPRYSIDVSNSNSLNNENIKIFTPILETISGNITNISCTDIISNNQITSTNLTVTGETNLSTLIINSIDFSNQSTSSQTIKLEIGSNNDLSTNKFFINEISSNNIDSSNIISKGITLNGDLSSNNFIYCRKLIGNIEPQDISTTLLEATTISGDSLNIRYDASFLSNVFISGEISSNFIKATTVSADNVVSNNRSQAITFEGQNADFSYIHTISLEFVNTISGNTLKLLNTEISNNIITSDISAKYLLVNDISINNNIQFNPNANTNFSNRNIMDISNGRCILPKAENQPQSQNGIMGEIIFTTRNQVLNIFDGTTYKQLVLGNDFANFKLNTTITGNNIIYDMNNGNSIDNSNNLLIGNNNEFKIIPIIFDSSANNSKFHISSYLQHSDLPGLIDISNSELDDKLIEINANICLRFINKVPGDVEACTYEFILFDSSKNSLNKDNVNTDISLVSIKNTILVIDNSFNFSNSNLTYILNKTQTKYLYFCIATDSKQDSETNLNYLSIDSFHCSVKTI